MKDVRLAIIGAGVIGKRHIAAIDDTPGCELVAIADPVPAGRSTAEENGVEWFAETAAMLGSTGPDGVIVATPTEHHLHPVLSALDAGADVLVEKPITPTLDQAATMIEKSAETDRHVLVGHHRRYYPQVHKARELVRGGALGALVAVTGQWTVRKHDDYYTPDWRKGWQAGPVLTNLIHDIDSLRYICGEITSLSAETANNVQGFEKEDAAAIVMRFQNGALATFILSDRTVSPWGWEFATGENPAFPKSAQNAVRFMGTEASLEFPNLVLWQHENGRHDWNQSIRPQAIPLELGDAYIRQIAHFGAVIKGEETPRITAGDATESLRATLAVFESAEHGRRVTL